MARRPVRTSALLVAATLALAGGTRAGPAARQEPAPAEDVVASAESGAPDEPVDPGEPGEDAPAPGSPALREGAPQTGPAGEGDGTGTRQDVDALLDEILTERSLENVPSPFASGDRLDLTLQDAVRIALENDLGLKQEELSAEVARYNYVGTWGAFDPVLRGSGRVVDSKIQPSTTLGGAQQLEFETQAGELGLDYPLITGGTVSVDYTRNNTKTNNQFQIINPSTEDSLTVALTQPLLRGAWKDVATSQQREAEFEVARAAEQARTARNDLIFAVHQAYWDLVSAREQLGVAQTSLELGLEQLEQNRRRLDAGVGTEVEVLQAEANVATSVQVRIDAAVAVAQASDQLKSLLFPGRSERTWNLLLTPRTPLPEEASAEGVRSWQEELIGALEYRGELRQQRLRVLSSEVALERASSLRLPALDLVLSAAGNGFDGEPSDAFDKAANFDFPTYTAQLAFSYPLGNRSASNAERSARAQVRSERLAYDQLETQVVAEVRGAVLQLLSRIAAVRAAQSTLDLTRRQLEAERARYREGLTTNFQVLEFQDEFARALSAERRARADYAMAWVALYDAKGVLVERDGGAAEEP